MPKPASPVISGLEEFETYRGGPRAGQTWNDELPCLLVGNGKPEGIGIMCRWELSEADRAAVASGADIMLTLFTGGRCPPMWVEIFSKDCDPQRTILEQRGVITNIPENMRKYSPGQIEEMRKPNADRK